MFTSFIQVCVAVVLVSMEAPVYLWPRTHSVVSVSPDLLDCTVKQIPIPAHQILAGTEVGCHLDISAIFTK